MTGIKFDAENVKKCIESYYFMYGEYPYLICNEKTRKLIIQERDKDNTFTINCNIINSNTMSVPIYPEDFTIGDIKYIKESNINKNHGTYCNAKILIDNELKFGEIHVG